jgi:2',3'-cyclic-nucleotide 2'-phosphodiesterase (5'-nucleotidase family)
MNKKLFKSITYVILATTLLGCTIDFETSSSSTPSIVSSTSSTSTSSSPHGQQTLTIFSINDLHGAIEDAESKGFAYISGYIENYKQKNNDSVIFLSAGDALQGTALSNFNLGAPVIESLNLAGLDAYTIGNHEFDWGLDVIKSYTTGDNDYDIKANYPILGANIYSKATNQRVDWIEPYTIIERGDLSIGVIGTIGYGLEGDIATNRVSDYKFVDPYPIVESLAYDLRTNKGVDIIVVSAHDASTSFNEKLAKLTDSKLIDAVINGHTHYTYEQFLTRNTYAPLPVIQSGSSGTNIGKITLEYDYSKGRVTSSSVKNIYVPENYNSIIPNATIVSYINDEITKIAPVINEVLGIAGQTIYKSDASIWGANVIKKVTGADIAFTNNGGFRSSAFPIYKNESVTYARLIEMMPFDNMIKTTTISGSKLQEFINSAGTSMAYDSSFKGIDVTKTYTIATVDYVFDQSYNPFVKYGVNTVNTGILFRDVLVEDIREACKDGSKWIIK